MSDLSTEEWLEQISYQLHKQNQLLAALVERDNEPEEQPELYRCEFCDDTVRKEQRETHLSQNHNPPSGVDIDKRFTEA